MQILKYIVVFVALFGGLFLFGHLLNGAFSGQEEFECNQWQAQAKTYENFYITKWQKAQCEHYNIEIDAPVY